MISDQSRILILPLLFGIAALAGITALTSITALTGIIALTGIAALFHIIEIIRDKSQIILFFLSLIIDH
mgnify:CR=1 FL=1